MVVPTTCEIPPFKYQATPQPIGDQGASSNQINEQALENYIFRLLTAVCADLEAANARIDDLESRIEALEP